MRPTHPRAATRTPARALVVVAALAVAACGGPDAPPPAPELDAIRTPLEAASPDPRARWNEIEERTAACMAEQGFRYDPVPYGRPDARALADPGDLEPGTPEFAEQFGYGLLTLTRAAPEPGEEDDANLPRLLDMSPAALPLYTAALWGTLPAAGEESYHVLYTADDSPDPDADVGCHGEAERAVDSEQAGLAPDRYAALLAEMTALDEAVVDDPRLADAHARWASCMTDAGHEGLERVGDGESAVLRATDDRLWEVLENLDGTQEEGDREINRIQLEMIPYEIEVAVADVRCREEVGYEQSVAEVAAERQAEFVAEHRAELDAWLAAVREQPPA